MWFDSQNWLVWISELPGLSLRITCFEPQNYLVWGLRLCLRNNWFESELLALGLRHMWFEYQNYGAWVSEYMIWVSGTHCLRFEVWDFHTLEVLKILKICFVYHCVCMWMAWMWICLNARVAAANPRFMMEPHQSSGDWRISEVRQCFRCHLPCPSASIPVFAWVTFQQEHRQSTSTPFCIQLHEHIFIYKWASQTTPWSRCSVGVMWAVRLLSKRSLRLRA